jgi:hypothetical protein
VTERVTYEPGIYPEMPLEHYYADPAPDVSLNSSGIPYLRNRSPLHFAHRSPVLIERLGLDPAPDVGNAASRRGNVVHRIALGKGRDYVVLDYPDFRTDAARKARDLAISEGRSPILMKDVDEAEEQASLVKAHLDELFFGEPYQTEGAVIWTEKLPDELGGLIYCRALVDAWCPSLRHGVDLKSTTDASEMAATKRMDQGGYDLQNVWYRRGLAKASGIPLHEVGFSTLFCETQPPHGSQAFNLSTAWSESAWDECFHAMKLFGECLTKGRWPSYQRQSKGLLPPAYLISRRMNRELAEDAVDDVATGE